MLSASFVIDSDASFVSFFCNKTGTSSIFVDNSLNKFAKLSKESLVSMNMWGFTNSIMKELEERFVTFLKEELPNNPEKAEYFLPFVVDELLQEEKATVEVLKTPDVWHGVTYKEDKPYVVESIKKLKDAGEYPEYLWK